MSSRGPGAGGGSASGWRNVNRLWVRLGKFRFFWYQKIFLKNIFCRLFRKYCAYLRKVFWNICCRFLLIVTFFILVNRDLSSLTFLAWCEVWSNNQLTASPFFFKHIWKLIPKQVSIQTWVLVTMQNLKICLRRELFWKSKV